MLSSSGVIRSRSKPRNVLKGIVGTADATWGTAPDNLANATDENNSTQSGTGLKTLGGAGNIGSVVYDLGSAKKCIVTLTSSIKSNTGSISVYIESSDSSSSFPASNYIKTADVGYTSAQLVDSAPSYVNKRYFRIRYYGSAAMNAEIALVDVNAYQIG